jgi:hypothetical protein
MSRTRQGNRKWLRQELADVRTIIRREGRSEGRRILDRDTLA